MSTASNSNQSDSATLSTAVSLSMQRFFGRIFLIPLGLYFVLGGKLIYRLKIKNLAETRRRYRELTKGDAPIIVCANHLTYVDSVILHYAFGSIPWYLFNYRFFNWNLPATENFKTKWFWSIITYLSKCIAIDRSGSSTHIDYTLGKVQLLLQQGDICTIFPEGTRGRTGRIEVDNITYGVGKIIKDVPGCKALCVYLRGDKQESYSLYPAKGDVYEVSMKLIAPNTKATGRRAIRELSLEVATTLKELEDKYFEEKKSSIYRKRLSGLAGAGAKATSEIHQASI